MGKLEGKMALITGGNSGIGLLPGAQMAARAVDKHRPVLVNRQGEKHSNRSLGKRWLRLADIDCDEFKSFVATTATDDGKERHASRGERAKPLTSDEADLTRTARAPE